MYQLLKPFLFLFAPESAHKITTGLLHIVLKFPLGKKMIRRSFCLEDERLEQEVFGIRFKNPVGLAAGFDKNAELIDDFTHLGFGFIEMANDTEAQKAIDELNGTEVKGRELRVNQARPPREQ